MKRSFLKMLCGERGAEVIEYAIAITILAAVFVWAGIRFTQSGEERGDLSMETAAGMVPCNSSLPLDDIGPEISADSCK